MQPDIANGGRCLGGGPQALSEPRLVDVAEPHAEFGESLKHRLIIPAAVPDFEHQRVSREPALQMEKVLPRLLRVPELDRKLQQERAEAVGLEQGIDPVAELAFVGPGCVPFVREAAPQLCGVPDAVVARHAPHPGFRGIRRRWPVEGRVDLDGVKVTSQELRSGEPPRAERRVDDSLPKTIRPGRCGS